MHELLEVVKIRRKKLEPWILCYIKIWITLTEKRKEWTNFFRQEITKNALPHIRDNSLWQLMVAWWLAAMQNNVIRHKLEQNKKQEIKQRELFGNKMKKKIA